MAAWHRTAGASSIISNGLFQWKPDVNQRQELDIPSLILGATKQL